MSDYIVEPTGHPISLYTNNFSDDESGKVTLQDVVIGPGDSLTVDAGAQLSGSKRRALVADDAPDLVLKTVSRSSSVVGPVVRWFSSLSRALVTAIVLVLIAAVPIIIDAPWYIRLVTSNYTAVVIAYLFYLVVRTDHLNTNSKTKRHSIVDSVYTDTNAMFALARAEGHFEPEYVENTKWMKKQVKRYGEVEGKRQIDLILFEHLRRSMILEFAKALDSKGLSDLDKRTFRYAAFTYMDIEDLQSLMILKEFGTRFGVNDGGLGFWDRLTSDLLPDY